MERAEKALESVHVRRRRGGLHFMFLLPFQRFPEPQQTLSDKNWWRSAMVVVQRRGDGAEKALGEK